VWGGGICPPYLSYNHAIYADFVLPAKKFSFMINPFLQVGFAFVVGLTNLYNNYSQILVSWVKGKGPSGLMEMGTTIEGFKA
jgi:hypothetical protein